MEGASVSIVHRGGTTKSVTVVGFDDSKRPLVALRFPMAGVYRANLNHGWLEAPCTDWRVADADLERLRAWANQTERWVHVVPRSSGRPSAPKRPQKTHPKQAKFMGGGGTE
jgi:hypothetical protein